MCPPASHLVSRSAHTCTWGWLDGTFRRRLQTNYPWICLVFVLGSYTPKAQPMDAGIIAKLKGKLRAHYSGWVISLTRDQLENGIQPEEVKIPMDIPT